MVESPTNENYYTLDMKGIHVNGVELELEVSTFTTGYSTVLDSGTTFSYLPTDAFRAFADSVSSYAIARGLFSVPGPDPDYEDICFGGAPSHEDLEGLQKVFPLAKFTFKNGVQLELTPCSIYSCIRSILESIALEYLIMVTRVFFWEESHFEMCLFNTTLLKTGLGLGKHPVRSLDSNIEHHAPIFHRLEELLQSMLLLMETVNPTKVPHLVTRRRKNSTLPRNMPLRRLCHTAM